MKDITRSREFIEIHSAKPGGSKDGVVRQIKAGRVSKDGVVLQIKPGA